MTWEKGIKRIVWVLSVLTVVGWTFFGFSASISQEDANVFKITVFSLAAGLANGGAFLGLYFFLRWMIKGFRKVKVEDSLRRVILNLAKDNSYRLSEMDVFMNTKTSKEKTKKILEVFCEENICTELVNENGVTIYDFHYLRDSNDKKDITENRC